MSLPATSSNIISLRVAKLALGVGVASGALLALSAAASSVAANDADACSSSDVTWMRMSPTSYFISGTDRCGGTEAPQILAGDQRFELPIDPSGMFDGSVTVIDGTGPVSVVYSDGTREQLFDTGGEAMGFQIAEPTLPLLPVTAGQEPVAQNPVAQNPLAPARLPKAIEVAKIKSDAELDAQLAGIAIPFTGENASNAPLPTVPSAAETAEWNNSITVNGRAFGEDSIQLSQNLNSQASERVLSFRAPAKSLPVGSSIETQPTSAQPVFGGAGSAAQPAAPRPSETALTAATPLEIDPTNSVWALVNRRAYAQNQVLRGSANDGQVAQAPSAPAQQRQQPTAQNGFFGWLRRDGVQQQQAAPVSASIATRARVYPSDKDYFTVELIWNSPVDLDLHVFEPTAAGPRLPNSNAPGHVWPKASAALRRLAKGSLYELEQQPRDSVNREVYVLPYSTIGSLGDYDIKIDYAARRLAGQADRRLCGTGAYASIPTVVRIRTPQINKEQRLTVPAIGCGSNSARSQLIPVGTVNLY